MRRCLSVNTRRGFLFTDCLLVSPDCDTLLEFPLGTEPIAEPVVSLRLQAAIRSVAIRWNSGSASHFFMRRKVSRPDLSLDQGFGFRNKSLKVPWERHKTRWAKIAWGIEYRFNSAVIFAATSLVFTWITALIYIRNILITILKQHTNSNAKFAFLEEKN